MTQSDHLLEGACSSNGCRRAPGVVLQFADIFDRLGDGFFSLDDSWSFTYLNPAARKALQTSADLLGKVFWEAFPEAMATIFEVEFRRVVQSGATSEFEAFYPGLRIWLRVNAFPMDKGLAVSFADISETRHAREQLASLNRELTERIHAHEEAESFAHTVAHDLRAPLSALLCFSQALSEAAVNELGPRSSHFLRRIMSSARQMDETTEAVMTLCRLGRAEVNRGLVDLSRIAIEWVAAQRETEPGRDAEVLIAPCLRADCDPALIKLALQNLLSNAWKFTRRESPASIEVGSEIGPDQEIRYFVRDNGIGFAVADSLGMFEPFSRLHGDTFVGDGIGLATVKRVIDRHGGSLWAVSQTGTGSTFYFTLPPQRT